LRPRQRASPVYLAISILPGAEPRTQLSTLGLPSLVPDPKLKALVGRITNGTSRLWLTPAILATKEVEIRRIAVGS
jgi:hypothetical protein